MIKRIKWWSTDKDLQLPDMVNVMLNRRLLPLQLRAKPMWEHTSRDMGPILRFFNTTLAGMWTRLLKLARDKIPKEAEDLGFEVGYEAPPVSVQTQMFSIISFCMLRQISMDHVVLMIATMGGQDAESAMPDP